MNNLSGTSWSAFTFNIPAGVNSSDIGVVFNNGSGDQTVDLSRGTDGWFTVTGTSGGNLTGSWSNNCTGNCPSPSGRRISYSLEGESSPVSFVFFPNPFQNSISFEGLKTGDYKLEIMDISGRTVFQQSFSTDRYSFDIFPALRKGTYFLDLEYENTRSVYKIMRK